MGKKAKSHHSPPPESSSSSSRTTEGAETSFSPTSRVVVVMPGDVVTPYIVGWTSPETRGPGHDVVGPKLGSGLRYDAADQQVKATLAGPLECHAYKKVYYVGRVARRYQPSLEDRVIGTVVDERIGPDGATGGDLFRVHIGGPQAATLSNLAFEGASKRNRPTLFPGQVLYCRVSDLHHDGLLDPSLSCILGPHDGGVPRKDWMTNEGCYGELKGGTLFRVSLGLARQLLHPDNIVLYELSQLQPKLSFELAIGVNGFVWVHSTRPEHTVLIQNAIQNSAVIMTSPQIRAMVKSLFYTVQKQIQRQQDAMNS